MRYKTGDKVKSVKGYFGGQIGTIKRIEGAPEGNQLLTIDFDGSEWIKFSSSVVPVREFAIGDTVESISGGFSGKTGVIEDARDKDVFKVRFGKDTWWKRAHTLKRVPAQKFEVGDHVKGIPGSPYSITDEHMTRAEVVAVEGDMIDIQLIEHKSGDHQQEFTELRAKFFEKIDKVVEPKVGDRVKDVDWGEGIVIELRPPGYSSAERGLIMEKADGRGRRWTFIKDVEILESAEEIALKPQLKKSFQPGDRVKVIGNKAQGIFHYLSAGTECKILEHRDTFFTSGEERKVDAYRIQSDGGTLQTVASEDLELIQAAAPLTIEVTEEERSLLVKILEKLRG